MVSVPACRALRKQGVDVVHVLEVGLGGAADSDVMEYAAREKRILITRNYQDFAALVEAYTRRNRGFTGVLFLPTSIAQGSVNAHVAAVMAVIFR